MAALTALGRAARLRSSAKITAITGSVGKTGTKEALRLALSPQGETHASASSFNNHWGVPLSLARAPRQAVYEIYELGMNAPGEIAELAKLVRPEVALITTIAPAHLGHFPSVDAIAEAKAEIFRGLAARRHRGARSGQSLFRRTERARLGVRLRPGDRVRQGEGRRCQASRLVACRPMAATCAWRSMASSCVTGWVRRGGIG